MCGKLANWKSTKKMSWLERCCHRSWLVPPSSNFSSVSDLSMAYTTRSTNWSSSTGQRCLCCRAEIKDSIPKASWLVSEATSQWAFIVTRGWEARNGVDVKVRASLLKLHHVILPHRMSFMAHIFHVSCCQLILILTTELFQFDKRPSKHSYHFVNITD